MQTILLIRHARASERGKWSQTGATDDLRPLTKAGQRQAEAIAKELGSSAIAQIRTSPALRCVQTVQPLADRAKIKIHIDEKLMEGQTIRLPKSSAAGLHIFCAHGDNIPALLAELGIECGECKKGSIWMLKRDDGGGITDVAYINPE